MGSWHWGHRLTDAAVNASWVRRFAVRVLECLRFGFGMMLFSNALVPPARNVRADESGLTVRSAAWRTRDYDSFFN